MTPQKRKVAATKPAKREPVPLEVTRRYAAFLFVPGREYLLMGDDHASVALAQAKK